MEPRELYVEPLFKALVIFPLWSGVWEEWGFVEIEEGRDGNWVRRVVTVRKGEDGEMGTRCESEREVLASNPNLTDRKSVV